MDLVQEHPDFDYVLRGADGTRALVNDRTLTRSFLITPTQLVEDWLVDSIEALTPTHLEVIATLSPEVLLLGTGERQRFPSAEAMGWLLARNIGVEPMTNAACARTYNVLAGEGRRVAAAFLLSSHV